MKTHPKVIGFDRMFPAMGDTLLSIRGLYALRKLYPEARIVLFANRNSANLFRNMPFIDKIVKVNDAGTSDGLLEALNSENLDVLVLTRRTSERIRIAKQSNAKMIISRLHAHTLFSPRVKNPLFFRSRNHHESWQCLNLVRMIDKAHFDRNIGKIDFREARLITSDENKKKIDAFLEGAGAKNYKKLVGINGFTGHQNAENFSLEDWIKLGENLAKKFPDVLFMFSNFQGNPRQFGAFDAPNIRVFVNDSDLLNLTEFISRLDLLISVDTGNVHLADNLRVPTLELLKERSRIQWCGGVYGGDFEAVYVPMGKKFKDEYSKIFADFSDVAERRMRELIS